MDVEIFELAKQHATICRVFGNPTRILILWALIERELSVGEVATTVDTSLQNTSQHLRLMQDRGILDSRRDGNTVFYRIATNDSLKDCRLLLITKECNSSLLKRRKRNE
jgi:ArsR family transcriptional regulator